MQKQCMKTVQKSFFESSNLITSLFLVFLSSAASSLSAATASPQLRASRLQINTTGTNPFSQGTLASISKKHALPMLPRTSAEAKTQESKAVTCLQVDQSRLLQLKADPLYPSQTILEKTTPLTGPYIEFEVELDPVEAKTRDAERTSCLEKLHNDIVKAGSSNKIWKLDACLGKLTPRKLTFRLYNIQSQQVDDILSIANMLDEVTRTKKIPTIELSAQVIEQTSSSSFTSILLPGSCSTTTKFTIGFVPCFTNTSDSFISAFTTMPNNVLQVLTADNCLVRAQSSSCLVPEGSPSERAVRNFTSPIVSHKVSKIQVSMGINIGSDPLFYNWASSWPAQEMTLKHINFKPITLIDWQSHTYRPPQLPAQTSFENWV